ncbi:MAG: tetratricopeptide repeat protein [Woeseiaceae bacterium]|nr:tetratricopeptide repeat protein [Woeseiaceae bacterium]
MSRMVHRLGATLVTALLVAGCATTSTTSKSVPAKIETQEAVGFTITEEARIGSDVRADYDRALALLDAGDKERGIALLDEVAAKAPGLSAPHIDLGIAYHRAGELEAAEAALVKGLDANPNHPIALNELGIIQRKTGRFDEARKSYEAALAVYSGFHFARRNLAVLCDLYLADLECALENYEAYMLTVPGDDEASIWIADVKNRMGR